MSPTVVALLALAIILVAVVRSVTLSRRRSQAPAGHDTQRSTAWLQHAGETAREGRQLAYDLEPSIQGSELPTTVAPELRQRLDALTHHLAELATSAPTSMDVRVCRGVAVSSQALGSALGARAERGETPGNVSVSGQDVLDRHAQFVMSLGDLERHVDLL